ncbi:hypothetical protein [Salmonirosea aquatica]|uniref:Uncharacterized protein n=1 Tax=Salmonirosea aquatica TaxID=2654236 RepID=A0A7C9FZH4_9BACT|nr:hypothetical protein [Cytophagaceae bacterium SJW1-29]
MKTPDDELNTLVSDALRRKFEHFESQPDPRLEMSVFEKLRELGQSDTTRHLMAVALLITFVLSANITGQSVSKPGANKMAVNVPRGNSNANLVPPQKKTFPAALSPEINSAPLARHSAQTNNPATKSDRTGLAENSGQEKTKPEMPDSPQQSGSVQVALGPANETQDPAYIHTIQTIPPRPFSHAIPASGLEILPDPGAYENMPQPEIGKENAWRLLVSLTPTNTFQTLTVNPHSDMVYQNFRFPAPVSSHSLGYKVSAGLEKKGFQFLFTYGQLRQSVRYEIATDEFQVEQATAHDYRVVRHGTPVEDRNTFKLAGLAIKKHTVLRSGPFRHYFGDLGVEVNHELTHGQSAAWVNLGLGKQLALDNRTLLTVGPYLEYGFSKFTMPVNNFQIQPYQIGISIGISYSRR